MSTSSVLPPIWNVPHRQNPFFTGGEEILSRLQRDLQKERVAALSQPQGISGLGGIGKTQIALEYAYRYRSDYQAIFWVRADSAPTLVLEFVGLAHSLKLPERDEQDKRIIVEAVLRWFRQNAGWLLILDNMDDLAIAEPFIPKTARGHILFTTRARSLGGIAQRLEVQKMEPETGALLLLRRASILPPRTLLDVADNNDRKVACDISHVLDGLPLALDQAGAYIKETPCTLERYQELYQQRHQKLLRTRGSFSEDYPASVATTWSLSFEKVTQANPAAADLLDLCAFLSPDTIPEELITEGAMYLTPLLQSTATDPLLFDRSIAVLLSYSLITRNTDNDILGIHRLVQVVLKDAMDRQTYQQWAERTIQVVNAAFPTGEFMTWDYCKRCLPQAQTCATLIVQENMSFLEAARLLSATGLYLSQHAQYEEAEPLLQRALAICEQQVGLEHPTTATTLNNLAMLYRDQGKYAEAEPLLRQVLTIRERILGSEDPATATSLNNLALLNYTQGKYTEAEPLYERALTIYQQQVGLEHSTTAPQPATTLNNLALLNYTQGKYTEAEPLYERALAICEQQLGPEHPTTFTTLNNLAMLYHVQGKYTEAEPLYERALAICKQMLGTEHPNTVSSLNNLAMLYHAQGKYTEAEPLLQQAMVICEQILGSEHPTTANSLHNLVVLYYAQGRYEEAEPLLQRALATRERMLGQEHPDTANSLNNLAALYLAQGRYEEAEPLLQRALTIREEQVGAVHPDTAENLNNLAELYRIQGKYAEAEPLLQRALVIWEQVLGPEHPTTASLLNNLAMLYRDQGKYAEAEPLYERALVICEQQLGPEHPTTASLLNNLAMLYYTQGKYAEAEPLYERALVICEQQLGPEHPTTLVTRRNYASLLRAIGREVEAVQLEEGMASQ